MTQQLIIILGYTLKNEDLIKLILMHDTIHQLGVQNEH